LSECQVNNALEAIVGKWKHKILFPLLNNETMRFNELKREIPGITQKMLTSQLRELEVHDLVTRKVYAQIPPKVEYSLSEHGKSLIPILDMMSEWGASHAAHLATRNEEQIKNTRKEGKEHA
jgi:DNA-binding HxlR family transcriptional regulator